MSEKMVDPEGSLTEKHQINVLDREEGSVEDFGAGDSIWAKLQRIAGGFGVEQRGIQRVPENERTDKTLSKIGTLWLSTNMVVSTFAIGALATPIFSLSFLDAAMTIIFINILGIFPVCFFSTFGPRFGLRQMVLSRFYFGYYGVKISKSTCSLCVHDGTV
jgi:Permease for cytosine/purines, uracil, thiamine, allantoin